MARTTSQFRSGLLMNGNFETGSGSQAGAGWIGSEFNFWRMNDAAGTASFDTSTFHGGSQSLKIVKNSAGGVLSINNINDTDLTTLAYHGLKVLPSTSYNYSIWYKTDGTTGPRIQLHEYSSSAFLQTYFNTILSTPTVWTNYQTTFTTGTAVVNVAVVPGRYNGGEGGDGTFAYFDDIQIQQTSRTTASARSVASVRSAAV